MKQLIAITTAIVMASSTAFADAKSDKQAFREAYKAYQEAVAAGKRLVAIEQARLAFEYGEKVYGPDHKNTATLLLNYGRLVYRNEEANILLEDAVARYEKIYGKDGPEMIDPLMDLAAHSAGFGTLGDAKKIYRRALRLTEAHFPDNNLMLGVIRLEMGEIALQEAGSREALSLINKAIKTLGQADPDQARTYLAEANFYLGKFELARKRYKKASSYLQTSLAVFEDYSPTGQTTLTNHAFLVEAYENLGMRDEATRHCRAIGSRTPSNPDQDFLPVYRASPVYPVAAQRSGIEGYAIVELTVDENGFVVDPFIVDSSGYKGFEKASLKAASQHRYAPRFENGEAVATTGVRYRFTYGLRN